MSWTASCSRSAAEADRRRRRTGRSRSRCRRPAPRGWAAFRGRAGGYPQRMSVPSPGGRRAALVTLGCARNEVDSEELAGRLAADGWDLTEEEDADVVLVNTCAFVASAKKDSIDTLLAAADGDRTVVAVGCLAERYGTELADSLPEAAAVLGFDSYAEIGDRLDDVLAGRPLVPHTPRDRRTLLPIAPVRRP